MVKWWVVAVALAVGLVGGFVACYFGIVAPTNESVRQLESRLTDAQDTNRRVTIENQHLRNELARVVEAGRAIENDNQQLRIEASKLASTHKLLTGSIERSLKEVGSIASLGDDIASTVERIAGIVSELERVYRKVGR